MQTYTFKVVVEPDEGGFHAYCPALRSQGAVTQGRTEEEALKNIHELVQMIVDELREDGLPLPASSDDMEISTKHESRSPSDPRPCRSTIQKFGTSPHEKSFVPSSPTDSTSGRIKAKLATAGIYHSDGRRVSVQFHGSGSTFVPKTLRSMIEEQARWTEEDLKRLKLIR